MIDVILALIALGVLVTVHETGHFCMARWCGVRVEVFSIGFGKTLFSFTRHEIEYRLGWIPLGGYVKMKGEQPDADEPPSSDSFAFARWWKKALIGLAGPTANLIAGLLIFIITFLLPNQVEDHYPVVGSATGEYAAYFMPADTLLTLNNIPVKGWYQFIGKLQKTSPNEIRLARMGHRLLLTLPAQTPESLMVHMLPRVPARVGDVNPGLPAWRAGLKTGDLILAVDSTSVSNWYTMRELITQPGRDSVRLTFQRNQQILHKTMPLEANPLDDKQRLIGITQYMPVSYTNHYRPLQAINYGWQSTFGFLAVTYSSLVKVIAKPALFKNSLGGPVMIVSLSNQSIQKGWNYWLMFIGCISLLLMMMNLLPIPVLDGGHIMFALLQAVRGRPLPQKVQIVLQNIGLTLLILLMLYAFYNDFSRVISRAISTMPK